MGTLVNLFATQGGGNAYFDEASSRWRFYDGPMRGNFSRGDFVPDEWGIGGFVRKELLSILSLEDSSSPSGSDLKSEEPFGLSFREVLSRIFSVE